MAGIAFGAGCDAARTAGPRLPSYASRSPAIRTGYLFASGEGAALLTQLPCYCACAALGHKHLRDCFISDAGVFDSHAAGCQVCIDEALDARAMLARGTPARDIRAAIDRTYAGRGKPTDTPPVA
ncbi:MAG TPA: PCYCGC motif-containing (lipo)protein [Chloroflexota bacterium]|nr:PCYCGC motif-containing (lipo)protein [Chloroflexota bacterium]